jgi:hypothetical protein
MKEKNSINRITVHLSKGGYSVKSFLLFIFTAALLLTFVSSGEAWQVNVTNNCKYGMIIDVTGEHLFWRSVDCHVVVPAGETKPCVLPGAICPAAVYAVPTYQPGPQSIAPVEGSPLYCGPGNLACCWNVNVELVPLYSGGFGCTIKLK